VPEITAPCSEPRARLIPETLERDSCWENNLTAARQGSSWRVKREKVKNFLHESRKRDVQVLGISRAELIGIHRHDGCILTVKAPHFRVVRLVHCTAFYSAFGLDLRLFGRFIGRRAFYSALTSLLAVIRTNGMNVNSHPFIRFR
jgi:hypothetical protein